MLIIGLVVGYFVVLLVDLNSLVRVKYNRRRTFIVYFGLLGLGFIISLLQIIDKAPPSPALYIESLVKLIVR